MNIFAAKKESLTRMQTETKNSEIQHASNHDGGRLAKRSDLS